jgi:hypothetical protein
MEACQLLAQGEGARLECLGCGGLVERAAALRERLERLRLALDAAELLFESERALVKVDGLRDVAQRLVAEAEVAELAWPSTRR